MLYRRCMTTYIIDLKNASMCTEYVFIVKEILEPSEAEKQKKKGRKE